MKTLVSHQNKQLNIFQNLSNIDRAKSYIEIDENSSSIVSRFSKKSENSGIPRIVKREILDVYNHSRQNN